MDWLTLIPSIVSLLLALVAVFKSREYRELKRESREYRRQLHDADIERKLIDRQLAREDTLANKVEDYSISNKELVTLVGELRLRIEQLELGQKSLEDENANLRGQIENLKQQRELLIDKNDKLSQELDGVSARESQLRKELNDLRREWGQRSSETPPSPSIPSRPAVEIPFEPKA